MYDSKPTRSYRATVKNSIATNIRTAKTHLTKSAEAFEKTVQLLPADDPRRPVLARHMRQLLSTVGNYDTIARRATTLEDAQILRRAATAQRREVVAIRAEILSEVRAERLADVRADRGRGICLIHESTDLDPKETLYTTCAACYARVQASRLRHAGAVPMTYQRLN